MQVTDMCLVIWICYTCFCLVTCNVSGKGWCMAAHLQLIICTSFLSTLFTVTDCSFGEIQFSFIYINLNDIIERNPNNQTTPREWALGNGGNDTLLFNRKSLSTLWKAHFCLNMLSLIVLRKKTRQGHSSHYISTYPFIACTDTCS